MRCGELNLEGGQQFSGRRTGGVRPLKGVLSRASEWGVMAG
jgi:hypothetical protein